MTDQAKKVAEFAQNYGGGRLSSEDPSKQRVPRGRRKLDDDCDYCKRYGHEGMMPYHDPSPRCQSGRKNHCSCDICF